MSVKLDGCRVEACLYHHPLVQKVQRGTRLPTLQQIEWALGYSTGRLQSLIKHAATMFNVELQMLCPLQLLNECC